MRFRTGITCLLACTLLFASVSSICKPMRVACQGCASHVAMEAGGASDHHLMTFAEAFPPAPALSKLVLVSVAMPSFASPAGTSSAHAPPPGAPGPARREGGDSIIADALARAFRRGILHAQIYA